MNTNDTRERTTRSTRTRVVLIGAAAPIAIAIAGTLLMVSWLPELPDPIAVHWSGAGADGFGPALPFIFAPLVIVVLFSIFAVVFSWRTTPSGQPVYTQKILLTTSVWLSTTLTVGFVGSVAGQRGIVDAKNASDVGAILLIGAVAGLALAAGAWFLLPKGESSVIEAGQPPKALDLRGDERLSWSHSARFGNAVLVLMGVLLVVGGAAILTSFASSPSEVIAPKVLIFAVVLLTTALVVTNIWWRVSADHRGFTVRGYLGWPSKRIPLADIRTVQVVDVVPMRDFGGYGWRWAGGGRSGVILRTGPGIEVTASSGKRFVVTVDDAETGAGVIAALLKQNSVAW